VDSQWSAVKVVVVVVVVVLQLVDSIAADSRNLWLLLRFLALKWVYQRLAAPAL
jgi:hypothetical protein